MISRLAPPTSKTSSPAPEHPQARPASRRTGYPWQRLLAAPPGLSGRGSRRERHRPQPNCGGSGQPPARWPREPNSAGIPLTHPTDRRLVRTGDPAQLQAAARQLQGVNDGGSRAGRERSVPVLGIQLRWPSRCIMLNGCIPGCTAPSHRLATGLSNSIDSLMVPGPA